MGRKTVTKTSQAVAGFAMLLVLSGCGENGEFAMPSFKSESETTAQTSRSTKTVERDVEAPDVFQATEAGLWDGRPSLGGVWVAHPDVVDPERVIIRNTANDQFVIGALFRREREIPGPRLQISSDAAAALGMLAGAPSQLNVTALRREAVPEVAPEPVAESDGVEAPSEVTETELDPIAAAAAAIDAPEPSAAAATSATVAPKAKPASSLAKPFIQIGIFSIEANATRVAGQMRSAGMVPIIKAQSANGKPFWRVLVGPASSKGERSALLKTIKAEGFSDAYAVSN